MRAQWQMVRCCVVQGLPVSDLFEALAHALTSQRVITDGADEPLTAERVVQALADSGWPAQRLRDHRAACQAERQPWPHQVPAGLVGSWGQFHSLLQRVRRELGLDGLHQTVHTGTKVLGPAERRLLADKPPHHA